MPDRVVRTTSTSRQTAEVDPIVLRETQTTRLVFKPVLLDNKGNPGAPMDGAFVHQRKTQNEQWTDAATISLSTLKAGEGVKLELRAAQLKTLFDGVGAYYSLVDQYGVGFGTREFILAPQRQWLRDLVANAEEFRATLQDDDLAGTLLSGLIAWIADNETAVAAAQLEGVSLDDLQQFDAVLALARLQLFCRLLEENADNDNESFWQNTLSEHGWVIAQVFAIPTMLIESQVYVGGKRFTNRDGNVADFLYQNDISGNVVLVESRRRRFQPSDPNTETTSIRRLKP